VLVDVRTYTLKPGKLAPHVAIYQEHGFAAQTRHLGQPIAWLTAESGELNTIVHLWAYEDAAERAKKRAAMQADPAWQEYLRRSGEAGYLVQQRNSLMIPASFAPIKR
jgi:aromatic ring-cleaving dioxygenase